MQLYLLQYLTKSSSKSSQSQIDPVGYIKWSKIQYEHPSMSPHTPTTNALLSVITVQKVN